MIFNELKSKVKNYPLFKLEDIFKWFPDAKKTTTLNQLNFWVKKGYLEKIRREVYKLSDFEVKDTFLLSSYIYSPSYISMETALNYYSIIPDIPFAVTSVALNKTKTFKTKDYGVFYYHHLKPELFFGFKSIVIEKNYSYNIASPEKALFDYFYLKTKKIESSKGAIEELRLSLPKDFNWKSFKKWEELVSKKNKSFHNLIKFLMKKHAK